MTGPHDDSAMALLAHKVAPFQFDIGYAASYASIRDQIVRAQMFVRAALAAGLVHTGQRINATHPLLICGAGVAGMAAAMEACRLRVHFILIDKKGDPDSKKSEPNGAIAGKGKRYVSPTMYEWPASISAEHAHPIRYIRFLGSDLSNPNFIFRLGKPVLISDFAKHVRKQVDAHSKKWLAAAAAGAITSNWYLRKTTISLTSKEALRATIKTGNQITALPPIEFETTRDINKGPFQFSCILFASGFSEESTDFCGKPMPTKPFWDADALLRPRLGTPVPSPTLLVVGGGDGAIQDAIRGLVDPRKIPHPTALWDHLSAGPLPAVPPGVIVPFALTPAIAMTTEELYRQILSVEMYSSLAYAWVPAKNIYKDIDGVYARLAEQYIVHQPDVVRRLAGILRKDVSSVTVSTSNGFSKTYALNRFLIHLLVKARQCLGAGYPTLQIRTSKAATFVPSPIDPAMGDVTFEDGTTAHFDHIVVRAGARHRAFQAIGLSGIAPSRVELGRLPVPLMAPDPV